MLAQRILRIGLVLLMVAVLLTVAGCSDDDPVTPVHLPEDDYLAVSPDSLMTLWQTALSTMDSTMYRDMHDPDFRFQFSDSDMNDFQLPTDFMTRDETVQTGWNMFSGENITNWQGVVVQGVASISFPAMTQETPWEIVAAGSAPAMAKARFTLQMYVERNYGVTTMFAAGSFDFFAVSRDTVLEDGTATQYYQLIDMIAVNPGEKISEVNSWGGVYLTYLTNEAPLAVLEVSDVGGSPLPVIRCDASGSSDDDSGLHQEPYRWQFSSGGVWTSWREDPIANTSYPMPGDYTISVQVRDRWGLTGAAEQDFTVLKPELPFPGSPDQLMANFRTIYETRDVEDYRKIMHLDFLTILQDETITEFPDVGTTLDVNEELRIHERMFSGEAVTDPNGYLVPGVLNIDFRVFRALDAWTMSPLDDPIPEAEWAPFEVSFWFDRGQSYSTLIVDGMIKFYVTSRDSLHEGIDRQYYQMIGQVDLTGFKATETTNWGTVKALFRYPGTFSQVKGCSR